VHLTSVTGITSRINRFGHAPLGRARVGVAQAAFGRAGAVFEAPAFVSGLDDVAVMGERVEERGGRLGVAEHARPLVNAR
jgi:hypothetical protein